MLSYLLKINQDDQYFKSKPFVLHMYECDPSLKPNEMLKQYIEKTCKQISRLKKKETPNADKMLKFEKRLQRIYLIFLAQLESNNANKSFVKLIRKNLFKRAISRQVCEAYQRSSAYQLMRSSYDKKIKGLAKTIKQDVKKYLKRDMIDHNQSKEEEQIVIKLEGEQENNIDCAEKESIIEMNNEDYMHVRTELSLFQKYLQHPLFNNTK
ncbi:hypothetical protein BD408DRAFT_32245 [Parasitella parasitica]|nr:hypothetical protein BD408DRAFT_32245 [Parasitella parasitica]